MSHELKTPVNVIYSAVQTVNIYFGNYNLENIEKCKLYFKTMKQNCLRLIRIINNFLDVTKLNSDSGFIRIKKRNGNIVNIIEEITQSVASYVNDKDITLIFDTNVEEKIMGFDHDMMERIMLNLISNALKYSHSKGNIYVDFIDKQTSVIVKVRDEGEGIPKDKLNFIFERFGKVDNTLSRKCEGTGIGLYLVKSFVEMHGGKISVASVEGQGSEFIIELPVELIKNEEEEDKILFKTNIEKIQIEFSDIYSLQS
jgi:signal transduction histidine kinase